MLFTDIIMLVIGIALVSYFSNRTVEHAANSAHKLKISSLIVGVVIISLGTDLPEIANSLFSSYTGHGDINVGNAIGSSLSQISLVTGIAVFAADDIEWQARGYPQ
jgi:cation:H+ antiporter